MLDIYASIRKIYHTARNRKKMMPFVRVIGEKTQSHQSIGLHRSPGLYGFIRGSDVNVII